MYLIFGVQYIFELQVCRQSSASTACDKLAIGRNPTRPSDEGKGFSTTALGISHLRMTSIKSLPRYAHWQSKSGMTVIITAWPLSRSVGMRPGGGAHG